MCFEVFEVLEDGFSNINAGAISNNESYTISSKAYWKLLKGKCTFLKFMLFWFIEIKYFGCTLCKSILKIKKSNVTLLLFENWMRWVF